MSRSSYIAFRFSAMDISSWRNMRSAEKPTTPPTSTAPRRKAIACCFGRSMDIGLPREKEMDGHVTVTHRGGAGGWLDAARRGRDERGVGAARLELARARHGDGCGEDERGRGDEPGPDHVGQLVPPHGALVAAGDVVEDARLEGIPVALPF